MKSRPIGPNQDILASHNNDKRDDARGGSFLLAHQQIGALALGTAPTNGQTVSFVINGTTITAKAVASVASVNDILNPGTAVGFVTNLVNWLRRPDLTNANQVAASLANQALLSYVGWAWPGSSSSIVPFSLNKNVNGLTDILTSFNITTTVTSGTWTAQTMQIYVEDGTYFINGTRYLFTGSSTPTVVAPVSHPRIDVLTINTSGTLVWTTGTEASSPVAPTYPANQVPICELYNVVSETALYDNENQQSGEGYIYNDVRPTVQYGIPFAAVPSDILPDTTNTRSLGSSGDQWKDIYGQNVFSNGALVAATKFGGTGADGALSITSGTTTINLGGASYFEKNYSSISITGTGVLTFSNPSANGCVVVLKSTGNVTITSSAAAAILGDGLGASAGNYGVGLTKGPTAPTAFGYHNYPGGSGFNSPSSGTIGVSGMGVHAAVGPYSRGAAFAGAGGSSAPGGGNAGPGGPGGIGVLIECAGALDFTSALSSEGTAGSPGSGSSTWGGDFYTASGGGANDDGGQGGSNHVNSSTATLGGGGGGGGSFVLLANFITTNTGTINVAGGIGGTGTMANGEPGGLGFAYVGLNTLYA